VYCLLGHDAVKVHILEKPAASIFSISLNIEAAVSIDTLVPTYQNRRPHLAVVTVSTSVLASATLAENSAKLSKPHDDDDDDDGGDGEDDDDEDDEGGGGGGGGGCGGGGGGGDDDDDDHDDGDDDDDDDGDDDDDDDDDDEDDEDKYNCNNSL
jgi:hypothetical protein